MWYTDSVRINTSVTVGDLHFGQYWCIRIVGDFINSLIKLAQI